MNTSFQPTPTAPHLEKSGRPVYDQTWIRLPRAGTRCPVSGLSRSTLAELTRPCERNDYHPPVEARMLKRKGSARGVLLVSRAALLKYLNGLPAPEAAPKAEDALAAELAEIDARPDLAGKTKGGTA